MSMSGSVEKLAPLQWLATVECRPLALGLLFEDGGRSEKVCWTQGGAQRWVDRKLRRETERARSKTFRGPEPHQVIRDEVDQNYYDLQDDLDRRNTQF